METTLAGSGILRHMTAAMARADLAVLYDNTDPDRPHREVAMLGDGTRWIAGAVPGWAAAAFTRMEPPDR